MKGVLKSVCWLSLFHFHVSTFFSSLWHRPWSREGTFSAAEDRQKTKHRTHTHTNSHAPILYIHMMQTQRCTGEMCEGTYPELHKHTDMCCLRCSHTNTCTLLLFPFVFFRSVVFPLWFHELISPSLILFFFLFHSHLDFLSSPPLSPSLCPLTWRLSCRTYTFVSGSVKNPHQPRRQSRLLVCSTFCRYFFFLWFFSPASYSAKHPHARLGTSIKNHHWLAGEHLNRLESNANSGRSVNYLLQPPSAQQGNYSTFKEILAKVSLTCWRG